MTGGSCELRCFIGGKEVWSDKLEKCGVVNLCASPSFFALTTTEGKWITRTTNANSVSYCICCVDDDINGDLNHAGELIVYSHGGRRVLPAIPLGR